MTIATAAATTTPLTPPPLTPRPDQRERWVAHREPVDFEEAAQLVLDAHAEDGERDDIVAHDLRSWAFGSSDGRTMQLAPVPLPGRPHSPPIAIRDIAFGQLAQRIGAPAAYLKGVRAIVSDRDAAIDDALLLDVVEETLDRAGYLAETRVRASAVGSHTLLRVTLPGGSIAVRKDTSSSTASTSATPRSGRGRCRSRP